MIHFYLFCALVAAVPAPAQNFTTPEGLGAAVVGSRRLAAGAPQVVSDFRTVSVSARPKPVAPVNTGFAALGKAETTGRVKAGFLGIGDGVYKVIQNDPYQMIFEIRTGFVSGRFTIKRDQLTGADMLGFAGQSRTPNTDWTDSSGNFPGKITYKAASDSGRIAWSLNGAQMNDTYQGGREGNRSMTITLSGNLHTFTQD